MNIAELALKVRNKTGFPIFEEDLPKFARALITEYEKAVNSEPVVIEEPDYHYEAMGCGLEDCNITDRYEAMRHGWVRAVERMFEQIPEGPLYPRPDPRVAELEAKLQQMNSLCEFNEQTMSDIASKYEALEAQNAALLVAIEALALSPSTELLEARDRKRDAKLLRAVDRYLLDIGDSCSDDPLNELAKARESGEWQPELGD